MKGIILAGGKGTRLYPITTVFSKQLLPVHDKPMIYYPMSVLMFSGIRELLIISTPKYLSLYRGLFGNGAGLGMYISYACQETPRGVADAFLIGENFIGRDKVSLILGDNIFYGHGLTHLLQRIRNKVENEGNAVVFCKYVNDPRRYGVVELDYNDKVISIQEKPSEPKTSYAITGLYFYDNDVVDFSKTLKLSRRGELEITDINNKYLQQKRLTVEFLGDGVAWFDVGTIQALRESGEFIAHTEKKESIKIGCVEGIAYRQGFIDEEQLIDLASRHMKTQYGKYLLSLVEKVDVF